MWLVRGGVPGAGRVWLGRVWDQAERITPLPAPEKGGG